MKRNFPRTSSILPPKNPEVKHVASQVPDSRMQKHGCINGRIGSNRIVNKLVRNESVVFIKHAGMDRKVEPINKHDEVQRQKKECDDREVFCGFNLPEAVTSNLLA